MWSHHDAVASVSVRDIAVARNFYEGTLGLAVSELDGNEQVAYRSGQSTILVHQADGPRNADATTLTWPVGDKVDEIARALKSKGVRFEHYDLSQTHIEGDVHVAGERRIAWFKDPDGNIMSLVSH